MAKENELIVIQKAEWVLTLSDDLKQHRFHIKFDGCVNIEIYSNGTTFEDTYEKQDRDYIHICDLDGFIKQLLECKKAALEHFSKEWPNL